MLFNESTAASFGWYSNDACGDPDPEDLGHLKATTPVRAAVFRIRLDHLLSQQMPVLLQTAERMLLIAPCVDLVTVKASRSFTDQHTTTTSSHPSIEKKGLTGRGSSVPKTDSCILAKSLKIWSQQAFQNQ
jgi:hypothetical protein